MNDENDFVWLLAPSAGANSLSGDKIRENSDGRGETDQFFAQISYFYKFALDNGFTSSYPHALLC